MTIDCRRWSRLVGAAVVLLIVAVSSASSQALAAWERVDFANRRIDSAQLAGLSLAELRSLRGIVFGKHGRPFPEEPDVQTYLKARPWYRPDTAFSNTRLSALEKANLDVIRRAEARKHKQIETGDMRFYQNRVITSAMLGHHTDADWQLLAAEIGAAHGQTFGAEPGDGEDEPSVLREYFDDRYWYRGRDDYSPTLLSATERANSDTIAIARMRDLGYGVAPGVIKPLRARVRESEAPAKGAEVGVEVDRSRLLVFPAAGAESE